MKAKAFFELSKDYENNVPVLLHGINGNVFKSYLDYVYTVKAPDIEDKDTAMQILGVEECFGCGELKLYVESVLVDKFLEVSNAAKMILVADEYSLPLLKEAAMNLYKTESNAEKKSKSWTTVEESHRLLRELLDHLSVQYLSSSTSKVGNEYSSNHVYQLDMASLRFQLQDANLRVDGSRAILIKRLKEHILFRENQETI